MSRESFYNEYEQIMSKKRERQRKALAEHLVATKRLIDDPTQHLVNKNGKDVVINTVEAAAMISCAVSWLNDNKGIRECPLVCEFWR